MYSSHRIDSVTCLRFSSRWMAAQSGSIRRRWPCFVPALANSLSSSAASVISSGSGQLRPAAWKRLSVARTVDAATPIRRAISRVGTPPTNFNRRTSRTWRMVVLSAGIRSSFGSQRSGPESASRGTRPPGRDHSGMAGDIISERWAELSRNGGRHHSGIVGDIDRNPQSIKISLGREAPPCAAAKRLGEPCLLREHCAHEFVPFGHPGSFLAHVVPAVVAFRAHILQRMVLDAISDFLRHASLTSEGFPSPTEIAISDDRNDAAITLPPHKAVERAMADGSLGILR